MIITFWTNFAQKEYLRSETEKVNITTEFCMFELGLVSNSSLNWEFWFFGPNLVDFQELLNISIKKLLVNQHRKTFMENVSEFDFSVWCFEFFLTRLYQVLSEGGNKACLSLITWTQR